MAAPTNNTLLTQQKPHCTDNSRECIKSIIESYLQAILQHDATNVPLAPNVQRYENGVKTADGAEALRYSLKHDINIKTVYDFRDISWIIEGNQAILFFLIDATIPYTKVHVSTSHMAARFQVTNGFIEEVEIIFCNSPGHQPEERKIKAKHPSHFICNRALF